MTCRRVRDSFASPPGPPHHSSSALNEHHSFHMLLGAGALRCSVGEGVSLSWVGVESLGGVGPVGELHLGCWKLGDSRVPTTPRCPPALTRLVQTTTCATWCSLGLNHALGWGGGGLGGPAEAVCSFQSSSNVPGPCQQTPTPTLTQAPLAMNQAPLAMTPAPLTMTPAQLAIAPAPLTPAPTPGLTPTPLTVTPVMTLCPWRSSPCQQPAAVSSWQLWPA